MRRLIAASVGGILLTAAGVAAASNFASDRQPDYFAKGTHQFYVWCADGHDYTTKGQGSDAEDAQLRLYGTLKAAGHKSCWPVWQGRVAA
jgi:hypothetical protein